MSNPSVLHPTIKSKFVLGYPYRYDNKINIYPVLVKDLVGNDNYSRMLKVFTISQEELDEQRLKSLDPDYVNLTTSEQINLIKEIRSGEQITPFRYLLGNASANEEFKEIVLDSFYFFTRQKVYLMPEEEKILLTDVSAEILQVTSIEDLPVVKWIDENEFFDFQNIIRLAAGEEPIEPSDLTEDPRVYRMKLLQRERDRVKHKKAKGASLSTSLLALSIFSAGVTPFNVGELPYAAVTKLLRLQQQKELYDGQIIGHYSGIFSGKQKNNENWIRD